MLRAEARTWPSTSAVNAETEVDAWSQRSLSADELRRLVRRPVAATACGVEALSLYHP